MENLEAINNQANAPELLLHWNFPLLFVFKHCPSQVMLSHIIKT